MISNEIITFMFKGSIKTLVENERVVYTVIGFMHEDLWWNEFFPPDQEEYVVMRDKLVTFLAASKISGIILDTPKLYVSQIMYIQTAF